MLKYEVLWSNGESAASRGTSSESYVKTHINVKNENKMWKIAYLLRKAEMIKSASNKNIKSIKNYLIDDWGYEEDEIKDIFEKNDYKEKDLDSINLNGIDGGEPWIISISLNGEEIYNCGCEYDEDCDYNEEDDEDW